MFHLFSKILSLVISPYNWIVVSFLLSFVFKKQRVKFVLRIGALIGFLIFGNRALINQVYKSIEPAPLMQASIQVPYAYAVVLGGGLAHSNHNFPDRIFFNDHINRLTECMELVQSGRVNKVILSGGVGGLSRFRDIETNHMKTFLVENNWPDSTILVEANSRNTYENALEVKKILDSLHCTLKILLITSAVHMSRAEGCFRKQGIPLDTYPADYQQKDKLEYLEYINPDTKALGEWQALIHEWVGSLVYKWKGYL